MRSPMMLRWISDVPPMIVSHCVCKKRATVEAQAACGQFVDAPYRFELLDGVSHWLPSTAAERMGPALLAHLAGT
jgi:hypothetical protein